MGLWHLHHNIIDVFVVGCWEKKETYVHATIDCLFKNPFFAMGRISILFNTYAIVPHWISIGWKENTYSRSVDSCFKFALKNMYPFWKACYQWWTLINIQDSNMAQKVLSSLFNQHVEYAYHLIPYFWTKKSTKDSGYVFFLD